MLAVQNVFLNVINKYTYLDLKEKLDGDVL